MKIAFAIVSSLIAVGCTSDGEHWVAGFDPPPVQEGYTRYVAPVVPDITPGTNEEMCQWIGAASDKDRDVLAFDGYQSLTGHHAVLYATTETNFKIGETHPCTVEDMVSISFLGGVGGEGGMTAKDLPEGLYFRVPAGQMLMVNTHWLNATDNTVDGQAVMDLKFAPASDTRTIADLFVNNGDSFSLPSGQLTKYDTSCVMQQDLNIVLIGNHMHTLGSSAYTEFVHADGTKQMLVTDNPWSPEEQFNPQFVPYAVNSPLVAHAGDTYHTHCEWTNTTSSTVTFPDEMCAGFSFYYPSQGQITCNDGSW